MIYFDNAASSYPKPETVYRSVEKWLRKNGANPGRSAHDMSMQASELVFNTRNAIAQMFGVSNCENIAFVPNATYGLNFIIQGILKPGDHVIITDLEHNSVIRSVYKLSLEGVSFDIADVDLYDDNKTLDSIKNKINKKTKMIICSQCSNVCGKMLPIELISAILPHEVRLLVDGSQGAGFIPTDIEKQGIDYYCAPSHKGLLGPQGSGFVAVCGNKPIPLVVGGTGADSFNLLQPSEMPDLLESGTLPTPAIAGMRAGLEYINKIGVEYIFNKKKELVYYLYSELEKISDVKIYVDYKNISFIGTACFNYDNVLSEEFASYLNNCGICTRGGIHCAPLFHKKMHTEKTGMVRVSFGAFNNKQQIDKLIYAINKYKKV